MMMLEEEEETNQIQQQFLSHDSIRLVSHYPECSSSVRSSISNETEQLVISVRLIISLHSDGSEQNSLTDPEPFFTSFDLSFCRLWTFSCQPLKNNSGIL